MAPAACWIAIVLELVSSTCAKHAKHMDLLHHWLTLADSGASELGTGQTTVFCLPPWNRF